MDDILEAIRGKNYNFFHKIYDESGLISLADAFSEFINKRAYFTIDENGTIKNKGLNYALPILSTLLENPENVKKIIKIVVDKLCEPAERIKLKKIDRLSNNTMDALKKNYFKLLANSNDAFSTKYSKEMILKDKEEYLKFLFFYVLMEEISNQKPVMACSLESFLNENFEKNGLDKIIHVAISYISKKKSDFRAYENAGKSSMNKKSLTEEILKNIENLKNLGGLNLLAYIYILNKYDYKNEDKFIFMAEEYLDKILKNGSRPLSEEEEIILDVLLKNIGNRRNRNVGLFEQ